MEWLVGWAFRLVGRSGGGMEGLAPLSYQAVEAWARLMDVRLHPWEVDALMELDAAIRCPDPPADEEQERPKPAEAPAWPTRKQQPAAK